MIQSTTESPVWCITGCSSGFGRAYVRAALAHGFRVVGKHRRELAGYSGKQAGDPAKAAEAVIQVLQSAEPPRHLVLGRAGLENVENQLRSMLHEIDLWRTTSLGTDYPSRNS